MSFKTFTSAGFVFAMLTAFSSTAVFAATTRTEVVEEEEKKETKMFCSKKSEEFAKKECESWMENQKKTLGDRLLTAYCSTGEQSTASSGSCLYKSLGEIKYVLKKYRTETKSE